MSAELVTSTSNLNLQESWISDYELTEFLGKGSYGGVFKAKHKTTNFQCAVKITCLQKHFLTGEEDADKINTIRSKMRREYSLLLGKRHRNIVNAEEELEIQIGLQEVESILAGVTKTPIAKRVKADFEYWAEIGGLDALFIRMELCGPTLRDWIEKFEEKGFELSFAHMNIIQGLVDGVRFLHDNKFLHRDIKSENIFFAISENKYHVKIGDFGIGRLIHSASSKNSAQTANPITTRLYKAPELETDEYSLQADLFSLGLLLVEILQMVKAIERTVVFQRVRDRTADLNLPSEPFVSISAVVLKLTQPEPKNRLKSVKNLHLLISDKFEVMICENKQIIPIAKCVAKFARTGQPPKKLSPFCIPCTGYYCDHSAVYEWKCGNCRMSLEYGFDQKLYCRCGNSLVGNFEFRCTDVRHGPAYQRHEFKLLIEWTKKIRLTKEINILILGNTGVGKSTWINSFYNYSIFNSLEEAENHNELMALTPTKFRILDPATDRRIVVTTGEDKNESFDAGKSSTQNCRVYRFKVKDSYIRLIDTPGIADPRGFEQDAANFQGILKTISNLEELHGICILLKPNESGLNTLFRFCIQEVLTHLHKDASHNIIFCFTSTRGTGYSVGDTLEPLQALLEQNRRNSNVEIVLAPHTKYCYDSEGFTYLASIKNADPVNYPEDHKSLYSGSWKISATTASRMIEHISQLTPHKIKSTMNLNHSRQMVIQLTAPMADIPKQIQLIQENIDQEIQLLSSKSLKIEELEKSRMVTRPYLNFFKTEYPKTVCGHPDCKKIFNTCGENRVQNKICHDRCTCVLGNLANTVGDENLLKCSAMKGNYCQVCSHHYFHHMHIVFETVETTKEFVDESIAKLIQVYKSDKEKVQGIVEMKKKEKKMFDEEYKTIQSASAKFGWFLKHNAITPFNDAMLQYVDMQIEQENEKVARGLSDKMRTSLRKFISSYEKQIKLLERTMAKTDSGAAINSLEVDKEIKKLYALPITGKYIIDAMAMLEGAGRDEAIYQEVVVPTKPRKWTS